MWGTGLTDCAPELPPEGVGRNRVMGSPGSRKLNPGRYCLACFILPYNIQVSLENTKILLLKILLKTKWREGRGEKSSKVTSCIISFSPHPPDRARC